MTLGALALAAAAGAAWSTAGGDAEGEAAARPSAPPIGDAPLAARPATRPADEPEPAPRADAPPAAAGGEVLAESDERGDVLEEHHEEDDGSEPQADAAARGASPRPGLRTDLAALTALEPLEQLGAGRTKHVAPVCGVAVDGNGLGYALDARGWLRAYALPSGASRGVVRLVRGEPGPWAVAPDGQRVAVADREGGRGRVRSLRGGRGLELSGLERITTLAWAPDSRRLAVAHAGGVSLVDIEARRASSLLAAEEAGPVSALAFGAGGGLVIGCEAGPLFAFSAAPPYVRAKLGGHPGVRALALAPDGALAASGGGGALGLWDARALRLQRERRLDAGEVLELRFVADRRLLVLCERAAVWLDAESGEEERRVASPRPAALAASSPDGRHAIAVGPGGARVRFFDLEAGRETPSVRGHGGAVVATASSPRGLITLGAGGDPLAWRDGTPYLLGAELAALRAPAPPRALATLADGRAMLVVTGRGELHLLDFVESRARQVAGDVSAAHAAASARGDAFVVIGEDGVAWGLDASGRTTLTRQAHAVAGERVLPGEGGLLTLGRGAGGPEAALWRAAELVNRFPIVPARAAVRLGPAWLALGGADGAITLFDLSRGSASAHVEEAHPGGVLALGADPTGRLLLSSGEDGSVACWEATADGLRLLERAELATTHDLVVSISPLRQHGRAAVALGTARGAVVVCGWR